MRYFFVVNGRADKAGLLDEVNRQIAELNRDLEARGDTVHVYLTKSEGDATRKVRLECDMNPKDKVCFVACGGDGTINEVASGLMKFEDRSKAVPFPNKSLAVLAIYGNCDFAKYYPECRFDSVRDIVFGSEKLIDIIKVNDSFSINVCNIGFDAMVCDYANNFEGKNAFRKAIAVSMLFGRYHSIKITADDEKKPLGRFLTLCSVANCKYVGGEFLCAPLAKNDDGLMDVCLIRPLTIFGLLCVLIKYRKGMHISNHNVVYRKAKHLKVEAKHLIPLALDGEVLQGSSFDIEVLPSAISLRMPQAISDK